MKNIITGATGFIGQKIIELLVEKENEVIAIVRPNSSKTIRCSNAHVKVIALDLALIGQLPEVLRQEHVELHFDHFIHLGWQGTTGVERNDMNLQLNNVKTSLQCLQLARQFHCQSFFFSGSQAEYGNILKHGFTEQNEQNPCYPENAYGKAKLLFGEHLKQFDDNMKSYHGRIFSVYGPYDQPNSLIETMIYKLSIGDEMILGPCAHDWNFTYIDDLANMIVQLLCSRAPSGIYNLAGTDTRPLKKFVESIKDKREWLGHCQIGGRAYNPNSDLPLRPNVDKLRSYVDVNETSFDEGIERTIENAQQLILKR